MRRKPLSVSLFAARWASSNPTDPRNETLVEAQGASSRCDRLERLSHCLLTVRCHLRLDHFEWLTERGDLG